MVLFGTFFRVLPPTRNHEWQLNSAENENGMAKPHSWLERSFTTESICNLHVGWFICLLKLWFRIRMHFVITSQSEQTHAHTPSSNYRIVFVRWGMGKIRGTHRTESMQEKNTLKCFIMKETRSIYFSRTHAPPQRRLCGANDIIAYNFSHPHPFFFQQHYVVRSCSVGINCSFSSQTSRSRKIL